MSDKPCPKCKLINPASAQRCDCGYDFDSGTLKDSYIDSERSKAKIEKAEKDPYAVANRRINTACGIGLLLVLITLAPKLYAISHGVSVRDTLPYMYDALFILPLVAWLYFKRTITPAIILLLFYIFSVVSLYAPLFIAVSTPEQEAMLGHILGRKIVIIAIVIFAFVQGVRGAYALRSYRKYRS